MVEKNGMAAVLEAADEITANDVPQAAIERSLRSLAQENLWMGYDQGSDSLTLSFTGQPVHGLNVQMGEDHYVIVDPRSRQVVGFFLENVVRSQQQRGRQ